LIDYHEDSPMTKEEKLRWELLGFVKKVGFEPRVKEGLVLRVVIMTMSDL